MKTIGILMASLLGASTLFAQSLPANQRAIGYTVTDDITHKNVMVGTAGTYTMGAYMPASSLEDYKGCKVVGIRVAVAGDLGRTSCVLQEIDDKVNELHSQKQRLYDGWNNVYFTGFEYEIDGTKDLFYGFDYVESPEMVEAETGALCTTGEDSGYAFVLYQNGDYHTVSGAGMLCVQMIVDVTNMPQEQMSINFFDYGFKYKQAGEELEIFASMNNAGLADVTSLTIACQIDNNEPLRKDVECNLTYGQNYTFNQMFSLENIPSGGHDVFVYVEKINGKAYAAGKERGRGGRIAIYENSLTRNAAYLELYGDQRNAYTAKLDDGIFATKKDMGEKVIVVKTFRPSNPLGLEDSRYLHDLYAYTWPTFTSNRSHFPGEAHVAYDMNDYLSFFPGEFVAALFEDIAEQDLYNPSFGDITLEGNVGPDRVLTVTATGNLLPEAKSIYKDVALTVMVTEDFVTSKQLVGNRTQDYDFDDVLRGYVTAPTGKLLDAEKSTYSETFTYTIPEDWKIEDLHLVGILTQAGIPTPETLYDYDVINAATSGVTDNSGVVTIEADCIGEPTYYTLQGVKVNGNNLSKGVYIRVNPNGTSEKIIM